MIGFQLKGAARPLLFVLANVVFSLGFWMFLVAVALIVAGVSPELKP